MADRIKTYLILSRIQTGATTAITPVIAYLIGNGYDPFIFVIFLFGLLMHLFIFSHNNLCDWRIDPPYHSNPITRQLISEQSAEMFVFVVAWATLIVGIITTSSWFVLISFLFGLVYNWRSKKDLFSGLYLCGWIMCLYLSAVPVLTKTQFLVCSFAGTMIFTQWLQGALKDRDTERNITSFWKSYLVALASSKAIGGLCLLILSRSVYPILIYIGGLFTIIRWKSSERSKMLRAMSTHEILTFLAFCAMLYPLLGVSVFLIFAIPLVWYAASNKFLFATLFVPRV